MCNPICYYRLLSNICQRNYLTDRQQTTITEAMLVHVSIKMNPKMKKALEKFAKQEFSSVSGILKKAAEKYLQDHGVDWRDEQEKSGD